MSVVKVRATPVSRLVTATIASGTPAPEASVILPVMDAVTCASVELLSENNKPTKRNPKKQRFIRFMFPPLLCSIGIQVLPRERYDQKHFSQHARTIPVRHGRASLSFLRIRLTS